MQNEKWLAKVIEVLNNLGGEATLKDIYREFNNVSDFELEKYKDWRSYVRKTIYLHSSDCKIFTGKPGEESDIFYSVTGKNTGKWGLRKVKKSVYSFEINKEYRRQDLHDIFGGNRQRGISPSKRFPFIFIFTGNEGKQYGYEDGWKDNSIYFYTGEGQTGDQVFKEGNKALRNHILNGKVIKLFSKNTETNLYKYEGEFNFIGFHYSKGKDKSSNIRRTIVFELLKIEEISNYKDYHVNEISTIDLKELREIAFESSKNLKSIEEKKRNFWYRSAAVKKYALVRSCGLCESCHKPAPFEGLDGMPFLEVHHLNRLSDGGLDLPENVAAICPNCHRRVHYGSDNVEFNIVLSNYIVEKEKEIIF